MIEFMYIDLDKRRNDEFKDIINTTGSSRKICK